MTLKYKNRLMFIAVALLAATISSSCVRENPEDCGVDVIFDYSYNMLSANAFESQVDQVTLYIFDQDGRLVLKQESGAANNFNMRVPILKKGKYKFAAWAQSNRLSNEEAFFNIPGLSSGSSSIGELNYYMKRNNGIRQHELNNFLVGVTEVDTEKAPWPAKIKVDMKKVTNKFRLAIMSHTPGTEVDVDNYTFSISDKTGNGHVNYDYSLIADQPIVYYPYYKANLRPELSETMQQNGTVSSAAVMELSTSRLVAANNPRLIIASKEGGNEIVNIDLAWLLSLTKMENHSDWSLQEYLDRQDEYAITLFFDQGAWVNTTIIINGWVVNNVDIKL